MGGIVFYLGAQNQQNDSVDIATGNNNYMSDGRVPSEYFPSGYAGFLSKHAYATTPATVTWHLDGWVVDLSSQAVAHRCPATGVLLVGLNYASNANFASINQPGAVANLSQAINTLTGAPTTAMLNWVWLQTPTGFVVTFELHPNDATSVYGAAATLSATAGNHVTNSFTDSMNAAIGVPLISLAHISSNSTSVDTYGTQPTPVAVVPSMPVPTTPVFIPENPLIPFADCWEQSGSLVTMYFGYNNTGPATIFVPQSDNNNIYKLPTNTPLGTVTAFAPGFSAFAKAVNFTSPPTMTPDARWVLLNHQVNMFTRGVMQECKKTEHAKAWIVFAGSDATALTQVQAITNFIAAAVPNVLVGVNINSNGQPSTFRMEVDFQRGGHSQFRGASDLYNLYHNQPTFTTGLANLAGVSPIGFYGQPTSVEVQGSQRLTPIPVASPGAKSNKLGGGAIFGIIVAVFAGIALIAGVILYLRKNPPQQHEYDRLIQ